jgi:hypothetical protein
MKYGSSFDVSATELLQLKAIASHGAGKNCRGLPPQPPVGVTEGVYLGCANFTEGIPRRGSVRMQFSCRGGVMDGQHDAFADLPYNARRLVATTPGSANQWQDSFAEILAGRCFGMPPHDKRQVIVMPDSDAPGDYLRNRSFILYGAERFRIVSSLSRATRTCPNTSTLAVRRPTWRGGSQRR